MRIGIDLGGTKIEGIALGGDGGELLRRRVATPQGDYPATLDAVRDLVAQLEAECGSNATVGICTPGAISPATGLMKNANSVCLIGRPLRDDLCSVLEREVRIANDADCFALSEATDGAARDSASVFGVIIGTGTGAGIVVNGRIVEGPNAIAGEWGHNPLPWPREMHGIDERPGAECYCGKHGCIETWLSGPGMVHDFALHGGCALDAKSVVVLAAQGDAAAEECLQRYADRMARSLAHVINILDPHTIVLGGGLGNIERLYTEVPALWSRYVFSDHVATRLVAPAFGDSSGVRGAAWLWGVEMNNEK